MPDSRRIATGIPRSRPKASQSCSAATRRCERRRPACRWSRRPRRRHGRHRRRRWRDSRSSAARACRCASLCAPAASTGSPASPGAVETIRWVVLASAGRTFVRNVVAVELRSGCDARRAQPLEFVWRARGAGDGGLPRDKPGKGAAGIAGAENEERGRSCRGSVRRPAWPSPARSSIRRARRDRASAGVLGLERAQGAVRHQPRQRPDRRAAHQRRRHRRASAAAGGGQRGIAGIAGGDQHVAHEAVAADALDRRAGEQRAEAGIVERQQARRAAAR